MTEQTTPGQRRTAAATRAHSAAARRRRIEKYVSLLEAEGFRVELIPLASGPLGEDA